MGVIGCYTLDLYCDDVREVVGNPRTYSKDHPLGQERLGTHWQGEFPHQYTGQTYRECQQKAIREGWSFTYSKRKNVARCPRCRKFMLEGGKEG